MLVHPTTFQPAKAPDPDKRVEFQALYQALIDDEARNRRICNDVVESAIAGRSPLVLTEQRTAGSPVGRHHPIDVHKLVTIESTLAERGGSRKALCTGCSMARPTR